MAAVGKKSKKHKGKTIPLTDFLADGTPDPGPGKVIRSTAWADEVESEEAGGSLAGGPCLKTVILPTAPREAQGTSIEDIENSVPLKPPFKAYLANLHYDTNETDIEELFANMRIVDLQLAREGSGRLRGYGHVEFETRDNLLAAMARTDLQVRGRWMRISASLPDSDGFGGSERRQYGRNDRRFEARTHDTAKTHGDWRSGPRQQMPPPANCRDGDVKERGAFTRSNMATTPYRDTSRSYVNATQEQGAYRAPTNRDRDPYDDRSQSARRYFDRGTGTSEENRYRNPARNYEGTNRNGNVGYSYQQRNRYYGANRERQVEQEDGREPRWNYGEQRRPPEAHRPRPSLCLTRRSALNPERGEAAESEVASSECSVSTPASSVSEDWCTEDARGVSPKNGDESWLIGPVRRELDDAVQEDETDDLVQGVDNVTLKDTEICATDGFSSKNVEVSRGVDKSEAVAEGGKELGVERSCPVKAEDLVMQHLRQEPEQRSSIFGGAKPVDTAAREMEVEERLAREREAVRGRAEVERRLPKEKGRGAAEGSRQRRRQHRPTSAVPTVCEGVGLVVDAPLVEQPVRKLEVSLPPKENVWLRRAAQMAAKKEREQFQTVLTEQTDPPYNQSAARPSSHSEEKCII